MTKRMLIDATHAEETRVVVLDSNRLEDFDVETSTKKQLKGNIYLAKVVRVEPSLQAAFVEYGGNRHGFLAFGEIHPDYYQIPVADRQRLVEAQAEQAREEEEEEERDAAAHDAHGHYPAAPPLHEVVPHEGVDEPAADDALVEIGFGPEDETAAAAQPALIALERVAGPLDAEDADPAGGAADRHAAAQSGPAVAEGDEPDAEAPDEVPESGDALAAGSAGADDAATESAATDDAAIDDDADEAPDPDSTPADAPPPETVGGADPDGAEEVRERRPPPRFLRNYKIQEVIRRRQILLIQVVKEERGTKGAALTTYLSLAGRFCVLMPNSPRGGGISRKITSAADRKRLKDITSELEIPGGMGLIVRTAGANRPKPEIKRDCEYLLRLWDDIRDHTMRSVAPALIYEEASLIKRAIRDVYARDVDDILVDGEDGWKAARDFMRMLMPSHARKVQLWNEPVPLFAKHQVEAQLDSMLLPNVQLKSGGYLVINQAEALVAIDVNSGRSTRERGIEETALRTNLEAADEVARQLRLRDLAGLIVIDFIDMEAKKHNAMVERRLKDALKNDRARIQVGHISHFGLLEMSRQRLRPSLAETSFVTCSHCGGMGHVRSIESGAIHVLRAIEEEGAKRRAAEVVVHVATSIAMYILNNKRDRLASIEARYGMHAAFAGDDSLLPPQTRIERLRALLPGEGPAAITPDAPPPRDMMARELALQDETIEEEDDIAEADLVAEAPPRPAARADRSARTERTADPQPAANGGPPPAGVPGETAEEGERRRRRRRRRRRGGRREDGSVAADGTGLEASEAGSDQDDDADDAFDRGDALGLSEPVISPAAEPRGTTAAEPHGMPAAEPHGTTAAEPQGTTAAEPQVPPLAEASAGEPTDLLPLAVSDGVAGTGVAPASQDPAAVGNASEAGSAAPVEGAESDEAAEAKARRRGRRGGRRRRVSDDPAAPPPELDAPQPPVYVGPTPADPFGGRTFDIFDVMDQVEQDRAERVAVRAPPPQPESVASAAAAGPMAVVAPVVSEPPVSVAAAVSPAIEPPVLEAPSAEGPPAEPAVADTPPAEATATPAAAPEAPASEPEPAEPAIQPILVDDAPTAEPKRGWWRR